MKKLIIILSLYFISCSGIKDIPEAEITIFVLAGVSEGARGDVKIYIYDWYDENSKIIYEVFSYYDYKIKIGATMRGLIRR